MARHQAVLDLWQAHVDAEHVGELATPINTDGTRPAGGSALPQTDDQLLAQLTEQQGIDRGVDRLATDVGIFKTGRVHAADACRQSARENSAEAADGSPVRTTRCRAPVVFWGDRLRDVHA